MRSPRSENHQPSLGYASPQSLRPIEEFVAKKLSIGAVLALLLLAVIGCSSSGKAGSSGSAGFNNADVTFAQAMIPHHQQAVEMADMALKEGKNAKVLDLAKRIKAAQDPEIVKLQGWLKKWGGSPSMGDSGSSMHDSGSSMHDSGSSMHGSMTMGEGMMSAKDMAQLSKATGAEFDKMFLAMMIGHHQGAVTMAKTELKDGKSTEAKSLATSIIKAQETEIAEMKGLQSSVG